jgi:hypothetical protein
MGRYQADSDGRGCLVMVRFARPRFATESDNGAVGDCFRGDVRGWSSWCGVLNPIESLAVI